VRNITTLFFDVGGVVLTNGWDENSRRESAKHFNLNFDDVEKRHNNIFNDFEKGNISLYEYAKEAVFYEKRNFNSEDYINFIKSKSKVFKSTLQILEKLVRDKRYFLATINNESYELNLFRINQFKLYKYFSAFFSSGFLHTRKPESLIFNIAVNVLHKDPSECLFIDDRIENIEEAASQGIQTIHLTNVDDLQNLLLGKRVNFNNK
jgi:putative hydrolase of the HAD superfamily